MTPARNTPPDNETGATVEGFWATHNAKQRADDEIMRTADAAHDELLRDMRSGLLVLAVTLTLGLFMGVVGWLILVTA